MSKRWTPAEDARLKALVHAGYSDTECGRLLKRSPAAVMIRRKYTLGIHYRKHWSPAEDARLKRLLTTTEYSLSKIAQLLDRTEQSVQRRKERLHIHRMPFKLDTQNPLHVAEVIKFKMAGWTCKKIAETFDLKNSAQISHLLRKQGLHRFYAQHNRNTSWQKWGDVEIHQLRKCLQKKMPFCAICRKFPHRTPAAIRGKSQRITRYWLSDAEQAERQQLRDAYKNRFNSHANAKSKFAT